MAEHPIRIVGVEWGVLEGKRPRLCGKNARLAEHGAAVKVPLARITTSDGLQGIGLSRLNEDLGYRALGLPVSELSDGPGGTIPAWMAFDYPLWDLAGRRAGRPVYALVAGDDEPEDGPPSVACYDTSLYFDDLGDDVAEDDHQRGAGIVAAEAAWGYEHGHRAFKVKVGRGGRWMSPQAGLERDVAVVAAVRDAIGPDCPLFVDANNGYTLNGAKAFLAATASYQVGWLEEPFHEDTVLLAALRQWLEGEGLPVLLADGESASVDDCYALAARGVLDVVQCDILGGSFSGWLRLGPALDRLGVASAPHHFGLHLGNYVSGHLASRVKGLSYVEWDEATTAGIATPGYQLSEGRLRLSDRPGFGIDVDEVLFRQAVQSTGFDLRIT
jgi:L-rhamnonate dehydratase